MKQEDVDFWAELEKVKASLRQGAVGRALEIIEQMEEIQKHMPQAIDPLVVNANGTGPDSGLELQFDHTADDIPEFYFEGDELCVNDEGWDIDPEFIDEITTAAMTNTVLGVSQIDLGKHVEGLFRSAIKQGRVRREK
jgi:hypothetical protein